MNLLAVTMPLEQQRELLALEIVFLIYTMLSFLRVTGYVTAQLREGRLLRNENSPIPLVVPGGGGALLIFGVMALLFSQSPYYMVLAVAGVGLLMILNGKTADEQFGLARLPLGKVAVWSLLICSAFIFIEIPLTQVVQAGMNALHLPHPEQHAVETFRQLSRTSDIAGFLIQAVLLSPLIEEIFFRGFLLTFFRNYTSVPMAILLSAGIFAFAHTNLESAIPLWLLGVVLGVAYQHTGSLLLPVGIHACFNLISGLSILLFKGSE